MASAFDREFAATVAPELLAVFGRAAQYHPPDNVSATACTIAVSESAATTETDDSEVRDVRRATVYVRANEVTPIVEGAFALTADAIAGAAVNWSIIAQPVLTAGVWRCECETESRRLVNRRRVR